MNQQQHEKKLILANWKMNPSSRQEAQSLLNAIIEQLNQKLMIQVGLCLPSIYIPLAKDTLQKESISSIALGAQNCYFEEKGTFTGESSPLMLKDFGVEFVIVGHSERRTLFGEDDALIAHKCQAILSQNMTPVLCVGETKEQRQANMTEEVIAQQLSNSLKEVDLNNKNIVIAYEPVWAIGTGETCSAVGANRICALIRGQLKKSYGEEFADNTVIQYGGSVKSNTIAEQIAQEDIDGALVGGASLIADEFVKLVLNAQ